MRVTKDDVIKINELYLKYRTYAEVSRQTGFAPTTVKKYVDPHFSLVQEADVKRFDKALSLSSVEYEKFRKPDWSEFCSLTNEEEVEIKKFWKELNI